MPTIAIAIAISAVLGGALGAGVTSFSLSYSGTVPSCEANNAMKSFSDYRPVPTTGSKGF